MFGPGMDTTDNASKSPVTELSNLIVSVGANYGNPAGTLE